MRQMKRLDNKIKSINWLVALAITSTILFTNCSSPDEDVSPGDPDQDDMMMNDGSSTTAPDFELNALDGSSFKLSDQKDKVIVLFFFGNNCPSCKGVAPAVEKQLNEDFAGETDYVVIGLDVWDGNANAVNSFKDNTKVTFPLLLNASAVSKSYDTTYDRLVVIDKSGKIVHKGSRGASNDVGTVKSKVSDLLNS